MAQELGRARGQKTEQCVCVLVGTLLGEEA